MWLNPNPNTSYAAFGGIPAGSYTGALSSHDLDKKAPNKIAWTLLLRHSYMQSNGELDSISTDSGAKYAEINSGYKMILLPDSDYDDFETAIREANPQFSCERFTHRYCISLQGC